MQTSPVLGIRPRARPLHRFGKALLAVLLVGLSAEASLWLAASFSRDRSDPAIAERPHRILCAGDSHTYGAGVPEADSYPGQLREILEARAPGRYAVINVGVPGLSTTQVLHRLPELLEHHRPETIVVWAGVNDSWNTAETAEAKRTWLGALRDLAARSRLYRLYLLWRHDRKVESQLAGEPASQGMRYEIESSEGKKLLKDASPDRRLTVYGPDEVEEIRFEGEHRPLDEAAERRTEENLEAIATLAAAAGARLVLVTYPVQLPVFELPNRAIRRVGARHSVSLVDSTRSLERIPGAEVTWVLRLHPTRRLYGEVARDLAEQIAAPSGEPDPAPGGAT